MVGRLRTLPALAWTKAVIGTPKRSRKDIRFIDERVRLAGYEGVARQAAVEGLGKEKPMLLLTNGLGETARSLVIRYAGSDRIEDGLGSAEGFFRLDRLSSEARLDADPDCATAAQEALLDLAAYLAKHPGRLCCAARLAEGRSIGSGMVEGAVKQLVNQRLKTTGAAKWLPPDVGPLVELGAFADSQGWPAFRCAT